MKRVPTSALWAALTHMKSSDFEPGLEGELAERDEDHVAVRASDGTLLSLTPSVAETVSVIAEPSPPQRTVPT